MNMKKIFTVIAIILACLSLFIYLFPILTEKKKTNERCEKARAAKAAKAAARAEEDETESGFTAQIVEEDKVHQCIID